MRLTALLVIGAIGATALPASAQGYRDYRDGCRAERRDNQAAGTILGAVLGGIVGSNVAASGHRHDGTAVGAVLGGVVGNGIGRDSVNCDPRYYGPPPPDYGPSYPDPRYDQTYPPAYGPPPGYDPRYDSGYPSSDPQYGTESRRRHTHKNGSSDLYRYEGQDYNENEDYAGRDCSDAEQITRLPDGTEIRRTVDACRDAYYGGWKVRD